MLPIGTFKARATQAVLGSTKRGDEQVVVQFNVTEEAFAGERITWFGSFSDKAWERTVESLRYCGWTSNDLSDLSGVTSNEVEIVVEHEEWEGKMHARVRFVNGAGAFAVKNRLNPDATKAFAARMQGKIAALSARSGAAVPPKAAPPKSAASEALGDGNDSQIPF